MRARGWGSAGKTPSESAAPLGSGQAHPAPRPHPLTRVLSSKLRYLFPLEDEALRTQPQPDGLGQHGGDSQKQGDPCPPAAHGPLHPSGQPGTDQRRTEPGPSAMYSQPRKPLPTVAPATVVRLARTNRNVWVT